MMIAHKQRATISGSPPQTTAPNLKRDIAAGELCVQFLHIEIVAVSGGPDAKRMLVADEFVVRTQGHRIRQFDPRSQIGLNLLSIRIILPHVVLPEPYGSLTNRKGISLELDTPSITNRSTGFLW